MNLTSELTRQFHITFGHPVTKAPTLGDYNLRLLRLKLIAEEFTELAQALGFGAQVYLQDGPQIIAQFHKTAFTTDLPKTADALGDLDVVLAGTFLSFGLPQDEIARRVFRSNMSKAGPDGKPFYREDGKILKGPGFLPPDFSDFKEAPDGP